MGEGRRRKNKQNRRTGRHNKQSINDDASPPVRGPWLRTPHTWALDKHHRLTPHTWALDKHRRLTPHTWALAGNETGKREREISDQTEREKNKRQRNRNKGRRNKRKSLRTRRRSKIWLRRSAAEAKAIVPLSPLRPKLIRGGSQERKLPPLPNLRQEVPPKLTLG